jgi:hypothetical protein
MRRTGAPWRRGWETSDEPFHAPPSRSSMAAASEQRQHPFAMQPLCHHRDARFIDWVHRFNAPGSRGLIDNWN